MKETHKFMDHLLFTVNYQEQKWLICGDLKVVGLVLGLQGWYTTYPCFLCFWDSWADNQDYIRQEWPLRQRLKPGLHNIQSHPLVELNKILLPSLHIKWGVMKNFMKAIDWEGNRFVFLQELSIEKFKAGIFDSPQIRELMKNPMFDESLSKAELSAWQSLKSVVKNLLGNYQSTEYEKEIGELLKSFCQLRALMSIKLHFLRSHLNYFPKNSGDLSEKQWALSPWHLNYVRALWRLVGCKLSHWLLLVLETGCGGYQAQKEVPEKTFHPRIVSFLYFSVYYGTIRSFCEYKNIGDLSRRWSKGSLFNNYYTEV